MGEGIIGRIFDGLFEEVKGFDIMSLAGENITANHLTLGISGRGSQESVDDFGSFVEPVLLDEELCVGAGYGGVFGVLGEEGSEFGERFVGLSLGEIKIPEQAVGIRIVSKRVLGVAQHLLGHVLLPFV